MINKTFKNLLIVSFTALLFTSCADKSATSLFKVDKKYEKGIEYTKISNMSYRNQTKAIVNATYLNPVYQEAWDNNYDNFLIGILIVEDNEDEKFKNLNNSAFTLSAHKNKNYKFRPLLENSLLSKNIPAKNPYAKYYIVSFAKTKNKTILLEYLHTTFGSIALSFESW